VSVKTELQSHGTAYAGSSTGLTIFWLEILELAHNGDDGAIAQRLAALALDREHLEELFGAGASARLWPEYERSFTSFTRDGAAEIAKKIRERSYDDVDVRQIAPDRAASDPLRTNLPIYSVRLKRTDETDGIRIDTFVYLDGAWRTALKIGHRAP
jgi:hypothetical protein